MKSVRIFAAAASLVLLAACSADGITGPDAKAPPKAAADDGIGWIGGGGFVATGGGNG